MAYLALFLALGGTSYAAASLPSNSVGAKQLKAGSVTPAKLAPATVTLIKKSAGKAGAQGLAGNAGTQGTKGVQGEKGEAGSKGETGSQGLPGPTASASNSSNTKLEIGLHGNPYEPIINTTITTTFSGRIVANASIFLQRKEAGNYNVVCKLQIAPSPFTTFADISQPVLNDITNNEIYDTGIALTGGVVEPAGTYQILATCSPAGPWYVFGADITAVASAQ